MNSVFTDLTNKGGGREGGGGGGGGGDVLSKGEKIQLAGFGTFEVTERAARDGITPRTKETIHIPASKAPKFKAMKSLKEKVNN